MSDAVKDREIWFAGSVWAQQGKNVDGYVETFFDLSILSNISQSPQGCSSFLAPLAICFEQWICDSRLGFAGFIPNFTLVFVSQFISFVLLQKNLYFLCILGVVFQCLYLWKNFSFKLTKLATYSNFEDYFSADGFLSLQSFWFTFYILSFFGWKLFYSPPFLF